MLDRSRFASIWRLAVLLALPLAFLRGAAPAASSPRPITHAFEVRAAERSPAELPALALSLAPRRRSRSGMRAPSMRGGTWRPRLRPIGGRRHAVLAAGGRPKVSKAPPRGAPPPAGSPPAGSPPEGSDDAPPAPSAQVDRASALAIMRIYPAVLGWMGRFGVPARDAPDLAQDVVLAALPSWAQIHPAPGVLEATARRRWLFGVAWNVASRYRHAAARREEPTDPHGMPDCTTEETPETALAAREIAPEMALETLRASTTPARWAVFYAHDVEGLTVAVIATIAGEPVGTIDTRLRRARRDLREAIKRDRARRAHSERCAIRRARAIPSKGEG